MAGNATWNGTTNTATLVWQFPTGAAALRAAEELLGDLGVDYSTMTTAQKIAAVRDQIGLWWKSHVKAYEVRRDGGSAQTTAAANVDAQVDLA
jgi:hypothetical protein